MKIISNGIEVKIPGGISIYQVQQLLAGKQDTLTGTQGQVVGFDDEGKAVAQEAPSSGEVYSTEETQIGTWIDGKPVYRRAFSGTTPNAANTTAVLGTIKNVETITFLSGVVENSTNFLELPSVSRSLSASDYIYYEKATGSVAVALQVSVNTNSPINVIVEYTKTTDQATIELPAMLSSPNRVSLNLDTQTIPTAAVTAGTAEIKTEKV